MKLLYVVGGAFMAFALWKFLRSMLKNDLDANDSALGDGGAG